MSMRTFLFAADALRLEDGVEFTMRPVAGKPLAPRADVGERNAQAMQLLMGGLSGLQKKKGARR